ncbi:MAG: glycoside hydrolase family 127 protein, partial [Pirellulaceae bacterium]|nr:glycoside hydrolase family 127 protein [Pirellulaceae bacterium]
MRAALLHVPPVVFLFSLSVWQLPCPAADRDNDRSAGIIRTVDSPHARLDSVDLRGVRWTDGFWQQQSQTARDVTLPRLWELADDWAWNNMLVAAGEKEGEAKGCYWEDAWIYKWLESACYIYTQARDPALLEKMDGIIAVIAKSQQPDGYIATQVTLRNFERFAFHHHHELYTMGHLLTAACAHHRITGKTNFLDIAKRTADYVHDTYKGGDPMLANCPVNPSIIMGSVELYRTTGERRYLDLANIIINNRGRKRGKIERNDWGRPLGGTDLNQDR